MLRLMTTAPVSDMNRRPGEVLARLKDGPVALMARSDPAAVMVLPKDWNKIATDLEELENLRDIVAAYRTEIDIWNGDEEVNDLNLDELQAELDYAKVPA